MGEWFVHIAGFRIAGSVLFPDCTGMFAGMAISSEVLFVPKLEPSQPVYWLMMQIVAMLAGLASAFPANWWLIRSSFKEAM